MEVSRHRTVCETHGLIREYPARRDARQTYTAAMKERIIRVQPRGANYELVVLGSRPSPLRDFYHVLLRLNWPLTVALIVGGYLGANAVFAELYLATGGIEGAGEGSFTDAFFFSVQTMGTIGYGAMSPRSTAANSVVVLESVVGLVLTALATGLFFAKLSRPSARVVFSRKAVVCRHRGKPTLMLRVSNERGNAIVDAQLRAVVSRTERDAGELFYRSIDIKLMRDRAPTLSRSFSIMHTIDEASPFWGATAESVAAAEYELQVMIIGIDDVSMQTVHTSYTYQFDEILWGVRLVDVLSEPGSGHMVLDLRKFHDVEPAPID